MNPGRAGGPRRALSSCRMSFPSVSLLLASAFSACVSTALFSVVLKGSFGWHGSLGRFLKDAGALFLKPLFLLAVGVFLLANALWLLVLASQKLSVAYPVQIGLVIVSNAVLAAVLFHEPITLKSGLGIALIVAGAWLVVQ